MPWGGEILRLLTEAKTVSRLWDEFRKKREQGVETDFDGFVLSLDLLFLMGAIEFERGRIQRTAPAGREEPS